MRTLPTALAIVLFASTAAKADCTADFNAILRHASEAGPFRIEADEAVGPVRVTTTTEIAPSGSAHVLARTPQGDQEVISVGETVWGKVKGFWLPLDEATAKQMRETFVGTPMLYSADARNISCPGDRTVDGKTYLAFQYDAAIANFTVPMTLLVDPATRLPVKAEGMTQSGSDTAHFSATYKLVPDLMIAPPPKP